MTNWFGGVGFALFVAWLAISLNMDSGVLCVPQSAVEYVASGIVVIAAIVLAINVTMMLFASSTEYINNPLLKAAMLMVILGLGWTKHEAHCRIPAIKIAFERGTPLSSVPCWIERDSGVYSDVLTMVTPSKSPGYHLLEGPCGCGKTELLKRACHNAGRGVIYVSASSAVSTFHEKLASSVDFNFNEHVSLWNLLVKIKIVSNHAVPSDVYEGTSRTLTVIKQAAAEFKREYGVGVVLVIDNTAELARDAFPTFKLLLDWAKERVDGGTATVVFSSNKDLVSRIIRSKSLYMPPLSLVPSFNHCESNHNLTLVLLLVPKNCRTVEITHTNEYSPWRRWIGGRQKIPEVWWSHGQCCHQRNNWHDGVSHQADERGNRAPDHPPQDPRRYIHTSMLYSATEVSYP